MKASVIIPNLNGAGWLRDSIESIWAQTEQDFELIVIDNGSTDESLEIARSYCGNPRYHLIENSENTGFSHAVNQGIAMAKGEYMALFNNDAFAEPNWLEELLKTAESDPKIFAVSSLMLRYYEPELDVYARLTQAQLRSRLEPEKGIFIAESPKVIARALDAGYTPLSLLMERKQITGPAADILTRCGDAPVYTADRETLASLTGFELTRGVLCAFRRPLPCSVEEVCRNARRVAVLEGIVDSTNVGAIFRSAAALNMDAVLVTPSCCDPLCRRAVRVSMGTVFQVPWAQIGTCPADWPENGIAQLHSLGFKTAAMALSDRSVSIDDSALSAEPKLAIVLGTEGDGLAHSTIAACDYTVKIPMSHGVDSLNVAAASAVAFWQLGNR